MSTDLVNFSKDLQLWNNVASCFGDIYAEANSDDIFEWHVTISKFSNKNEYPFHFVLFWHNGFPYIQPKISLLFGQRCMVKSPNFFGNWVLLDNNTKIFTISSVLLGLRNIIRRVDTSNINYYQFNSHNCLYCNFAKKNSILNELVKKNKEPNQTRKQEKDEQKSQIIHETLSSRSSVSNLSTTSLTVSNCSSNHSVDSKIHNIDPDINILHNKQQHNSSLNINKQTEKNKKTLNNSNNKVSNKNKKPKKFNKKFNKNNKEKNIESKETEKIAVRFLEVDETGLVWKWTEGRKPNQTIILSTRSNSLRYKN